MNNIISKQELTKRMQELMFCAVELNLFLDTHPADAQALKDYNNILQNFEKLKNLYNQNYGSFQNFGNANVSGNYWSWATENWPWENK